MDSWTCLPCSHIQGNDDFQDVIMALCLPSSLAIVQGKKPSTHTISLQVQVIFLYL